MRKVHIDAHTFKPLTQEQIGEWDTWVTYGKVLTPTQTANLSASIKVSGTVRGKDGQTCSPIIGTQ